MTAEIGIKAFKKNSRSTHPQHVRRHPFFATVPLWILEKLQDSDVPWRHFINQIHEHKRRSFYRDVGAQGATVRVGMAASGHARWFERLLSELQFECLSVDRGCRRDSHEAGTQAEDGSPKCVSHLRFDNSAIK